jgi:hypothetical protein
MIAQAGDASVREIRCDEPLNQRRIMRLLKYCTCGEVSLTRDPVNDVPAYAILSHT